ncbi:MAG: molybdopterin-dependent oxidoreductase [Spirochaetes bacterium]|nr:molybdopterin-dependent oxidoreductase [Spirochaetota bacterium]
MKKIERKDFIMMGGGAVVGGLTGYVFSGAPFLGLQWLVEWTQDQYVPVPGREAYLKTICDACREKCEMSIRMIGDRAVKIESSNSGCPFSQNALQLLYHSERIDAPLKRTGKKGTVKPSAFEKVTWEEALTAVAKKMNSLVAAKKGGLIAGISKNENLTAALLNRLIKSAGSGNSYYEPSLASLSQAALGGFVDYDFSNADYILSFGARLFEGWGTACVMNKALVDMKQKGAKLVQADAVCTRTASLADQWLPVKPGTELILAMGIANCLKKKGRAAGGGDWMAVVDAYTPDKVAALTGLKAKQIEDVANAFAAARSPIAVAGRGGAGVSSSAAELMAVYALNAMVGARGAQLKKIQGLGEPALGADAAAILKDAKKFAGLDDFIKNGNFEMLFINEADPVYKSVYGADLATKMEKAFVVGIMPLLNDTAMYADYIFPSLSFLESESAAGAAPVKAYEKAIHAGDAIIKLAQKVDGAKANFNWNGYVDLVKTYGGAAGAGAVNFNAKVLKDTLAALEKTLKATAEFPVALIPTEVTFVGDGDGLAFPYVLKAIDDKTYSEGKLWVMINRETADKQGVSEGERIDIESSRGEIGSVKAHLTDIVAPDTIAIPLGFGHKAYTKYAKKKGVNPKEIMASDIDPLTGAANWWLTRVKIS